MARSFDGVTDRIDWTNAWNPYQNAITVAAWVYPTNDGNDGYFTNIGDSAESAGVLFRTFGAGDYTLSRSGSVASKFRTTNGGVVNSEWQHMLATDAGTDFADPTEIHIYKNGSELTYSASSNGDTEKQCSGLYSAGGRNADDLRNFEGYVCEWGVWDRVLNAGEITMLAAGYSPRLIPYGLRFYAPLVRDMLDWVNGNYGTPDGTAVVAHSPRVIYGMPVMIGVPVAAAETLSISITAEDSAYYKVGPVVVGA